MLDNLLRFSFAQPPRVCDKENRYRTFKDEKNIMKNVKDLSSL